MVNKVYSYKCKTHSKIYTSEAAQNEAFDQLFYVLILKS